MPVGDFCPITWDIVHEIIVIKYLCKSFRTSYLNLFVLLAGVFGRKNNARLKR